MTAYLITVNRMIGRGKKNQGDQITLLSLFYPLFKKKPLFLRKVKREKQKARISLGRALTKRLIFLRSNYNFKAAYFLLVHPYMELIF